MTMSAGDSLSVSGSGTDVPEDHAVPRMGKAAGSCEGHGAVVQKSST